VVFATLAAAQRADLVLDIIAPAGGDGTLDGIEVAQMIRMKQFKSEAYGFQQFVALSG
jgi:diacylglycerol kinase family enzyme